MKKLLLILLAGIFVVGCGKKNEEVPQEPQTFEEFHASFFESLENGNTNEAINKITQALANDDFKDTHTELFKHLILLTVHTERIEEAKKLLLEAADNKPEYLKVGLGQVCRYYAGNSDTNSLLDWTAVLVNKKIPEEFAGTVYSWRMEALYRADKLDDILALTPAVISELSDNNVAYIMTRFSNSFINSGKYDTQKKLLDVISNAAKGNNTLESFVVAEQINALVAQNRSKEGEILFKKHAVSMADRYAGTAFKRLRKKPRPTAGDPDQLTHFVLDNLKDKPQTIKLAAKDWVESPSKRKRYSLTVTRINKLMDMQVPVVDILNIYLAQFYLVAGTEDKVLIGKMMATGDALMLVVDEKGKESLRTLQLDGSFLMEDYAKAIKCIEAGIEGRDEDWHKMALNKVKSHLALQEGRIDDAIAGFREFMEVIKDGQDGEVDPSTGLLYSKEMMLGQNALRIADLYKSIGKKKESALAYEEAADYYTQAMSAVKPDSKEYALIQKKIKKLPGGKGVENSK